MAKYKDFYFSLYNSDKIKKDGACRWKTLYKKHEIIFMKKYQDILKKALTIVRPTPSQQKKLHSLSKKTLSLVKKEVKKVGGKAILAGSIVKDVWLPSKMEFDIFILFPPTFTEKKLENLGLKIGKKVITKLKGSFKIEYAEHPYVCGNIDGVDVDIVPCYEVKSTEELKSAVDRTPFHVKYIEKKLPLKLSNDVRLLKQFLNANEMYGADAKTQGFSGYACELLIIRYKSFINVLKAAVKWQPGEIIDIEKYYEKENYQRLRSIFKNQTLILIDPTDRKRNTTAALSAQNFFKFKKCAKEFLERPSIDFFLPKKWKPMTEEELIRKLIERKTELILITFSPPAVISDILWPQLRRFADRIQNILEETKYEFKVLRKDVYSNEKDLAVVLLEMEISRLPVIQKRIGPIVFDLDDSERFIKKYKDMAILGPYIENNYWVVEIKRHFLTAQEKLLDTLSKPLDILLAKGIPNYIAQELAKGFQIISETSKIADLIKKDEGFGIFLRKYFEEKNLA